ncbi:MAG: energy transducer TonB [Bdellovibrionales bacterium]
MAITVSNIKDNSAFAHKPKAEPAVAQNSMKNAFIASGFLHVGIVIVATLGFPFLPKQEPLIITPISVELVDIADVTQANIRSTPKEKDTPKEIEKPTPPKVEEPKPKPVSEPEPEPIPEPKIEETKPEPPKAEPIPEEPKVEKPKEKPKPKPKPKPPEKPKPKEDAFDSLLKNLAPDAENQKPKEETLEDEIDDSANGQIANLADQLTISELDAFKYQLEPCWNIPAGAKFAENLAVEIRVSMNRDGTVKNASVLNRGRYNRDSAFRAAADSALRALKNPRCSPLRLPSEKYEQWKSIVINFDPKDML